MLYSIVGLLITIGVLVTIHEWGHFIVARFFGVGVVRFSVGFGPVLVQRTDRQGTSWALSLLPLGGYVKMIDERESPVAKDKLHLAYNRKSVWKRFAIVSAGPIANLVLAFLLYIALHLVGIKDVLPLLGTPEANTRAAAAGIVGGETVLLVNGHSVAGWSNIRHAMVDAGVSKSTLTLKVLSKSGVERDIAVNLAGLLNFPSEQMGLHPPLPNPPAIVHRAITGAPAQLSGFRANDKIIAINDEPIDGWRHMAKVVQSLPGKRINISVERIINGELNVDTVSLITTAETLSNGAVVGRIGIEPNANAFSLDEKYFFRHSLPFTQAIAASWNKTLDTSLLIPRFLVGIVSGEVSWRYLNGPIAIADMAGRSLKDGLNSFVQIIAAISISLGIMNLLPLPVLDGGHLMFLLYEAIFRKPPNIRALEWMSRAGVVLLLMFMTLAIYNDVTMLFR